MTFYDPGASTVGTASKLACNFENSNLCGYSQDQSDNFDWTRNVGATGSTGTGPFADHSLGTRSGMWFAS